MEVFLGTYALTADGQDTVNALRVANDHTDVIDTTYTPYLEVYERGTNVLACGLIEGEWQDGTNLAAQFFPGAVPQLLPDTVGDEIEYYAYALFVKADIHARYGDGRSNDPWIFRVRRVS